MKAAIIGCGRIGCGFAGHLLSEAGYEVVFLARNPNMVAHMNRATADNVETWIVPSM